MIRIQKLKQPKVTSGKKICPGDIIKFKGVEIRNAGRVDLFVDQYTRKPVAKKAVAG